MNGYSTQRQGFDLWWEKNKPSIYESDPDVCSYASRAWDAALSNSTDAWRCKSCLHLYEEKVSQCDCLPDVQEWIKVCLIG